MRPIREEVMSITKKLVQQESIVNTDGEAALARSLHAMIAGFPYFRDHPGQLILARTADDERERYNVMAYVRGTKGNSGRTVLLMGHLDTVGTDDFVHLQEDACHPDRLMDKLHHEELPDSVREHLDSGDWLFGRGVLDMKSGLASNTYLLKYYSEHPEKLDGNLVYLAECDEEDSSHGILSALSILRQWKEEHGFSYVGAINADFVSPRHTEDQNRYVYRGTVGKLLPSFFITGAEAHVGSCFEGLDPNLIAAELTRQISYNPELCDEADGEVTVPPVSLKQTDLKESYTVQTALSAFVYYNFFVHSWTPKDVLEKLRAQALTAFENALLIYEERYRQYCSATGEPVRRIPWAPRVITYEEMETLLIAEHGKAFTDHKERFKTELLEDTSLDVRMFSVRVVEEAWKWMADRSPAIVLFYSSLYSPRVQITGETSEEAALNRALDLAIEEVQPMYPHPIRVRNFFPHISDMSFVSISDDEEGIGAVRDNNPAWGTKHFVDYGAVRELQIPVINIGPYGMDAHSKMERAEMTYSFEVVPALARRVIERLIGADKTQTTVALAGPETHS
ncbi:succinyl-diaminopimelate desuccinylase [Bhargavaea cecembensis DSE10]|uniref:Succinyl-diaminopimelate desuccinylase n=1 Tax=Bhargavaea cecembensis DSE10 TaxID=1235279 RepID=M7NDX5_9BACL|nr:succinyl-diaminopimelate desuccinylase [Bhargavaea cecembensis DSE10]